MSDDNMSNMLNNFNITPEMINNMANMLKNSNFGNNNSPEQKNSDSKDQTKINNHSSNQNSTNVNSSFNQNKEESGSVNNIDFETICKIKSIMDTLNKSDDPRSNLLYSLKPYLREPRRKKLDQYVNLFKISQVSNLFKNEKGDK